MQQEKPKQTDPGTPQAPPTPQADAVPSKDTAKDPTRETSTLIDFMCRLGQAYLASGEQTAQIELLLRRIASAHGIRKSRVVAFPTALFVSVDDGTGERFTLAEGPTTSLRLDQIAGVFTLGAAVQSRELTPQQGLEQLTAILRKQPRFGTLGIIAGHTVLSIGLALVLMPTWNNVLAAGILGTFVGVLKALKRGRGVLAVPLSVVAAVLVSAIVFTAAEHGYMTDPLHALIPPLVTFLPGGVLAMGMVELAYGDMVSGSSRLVNGFIQLVLLAFGLAGGAALAGVGMADLVDNPASIISSPWVPWLGVIVFGIGVNVHFCAPKRSLRWLLLVLIITFAAQRISAGIVGSEFSGFFGTLVAMPLAYLIHLRFRGPPILVTFLPSFWLLVPGALGLISVKQLMSDRAAGVEGLSTAVFVFASIALGTLMGASLYKVITESLGLWQLQVGRVGRYFGRTKTKK